MNSFKLSRFHIYLLIIALFVVLYLIQFNYDTWKKYTKEKLNISYNEIIAPNTLNPEIAKNISFGFNSILADWYWLNAIQYYGGGDPYGEYKTLPKLLDNVITLNPKFEYAYVFTLLVVPNEDMADEAFKIGKKGLTNLPDSWQIPYYMGTAYHINQKDYANAGKYLEISASKKDAPAIAKLLAAIYYTKADKREVAYNLYKVMHETSEDEYVRKRAGEYMQNIEIAYYLEDAVKKYQEKFSKMPTSLNQLVSAKIIPEIPASAIEGRFFELDPATGKVNEGIK